MIEAARFVENYPLLLVLTTRPEVADEFLQIANLRRMQLKRLGADECRTAIAAIWPESRASELPKLLDVVDRITAGVPLFIEEICHWVAENAGLSAEHLAKAISPDGPSLLESVLDARLKPLGPARGVARAAAVVGFRSNLALLHELVPELQEAELVDAVERLIEAGLLVRVRSPGEMLFAFRHALIQETIYNAFLRKQRQALHGRLVAALERSREIAAWIGTDALADHAERAGLIEKAISHFVTAGKDSSARSAMAEARHLLERAVELCGRVAEPNSRDALKLSALAALGPVLTSTEGPGSEPARNLYDEGVEIARRRPASERAALFPIYWGWWFTGADVDNDRAHAILEELKDVRDPEVQLQIRHCIWAVDFYLARHESCLSAIDAGLPLYSADRGRANTALFGGHDARVCGLAHRSLSLWLTGHAASALRSMSEARDWAQQSGHVSSIAHACINQAMLSRFRRDFDGLPSIIAEIRQLAEQHRIGLLAATMEIFEGWVVGNAGELDRGKEMIERGLATHAELQTPDDHPVYCEMLAELMERSGEFSAGLALLASAEEKAEKSGHRFWLAELNRRRARLLYAERAGDEDVGAAIAKSLKIASEQNAAPLLIAAYDTLLCMDVRPEIAALYRDEVELARSRLQPGEELILYPEAPVERRPGSLLA